MQGKLKYIVFLFILVSCQKKELETHQPLCENASVNIAPTPTARIGMIPQTIRIVFHVLYHDSIKNIGTAQIIDLN